ncbi:hypothetical protein [Deinococcus aluminii]|uniref:DUF35 domain-containing protein n=1 Tax=Deinococcus aluminii TaxID=1656885 RepID=A0ABP9XAP7_9DEIO
MGEGDYPLDAPGSLRDIERIGPLYDGKLVTLYMDEGDDLVGVDAVVRVRQDLAGGDSFTAFFDEEDPGY